MEKKSRRPGRKRTTLILMAGSYVNTAIVIAQGLLLVPLYLMYLGAYQYGLWLAAFGILNVMAVVNFGINSVLTQRMSVAFGQNAREQVASYLGSGIVINLGIALLFVALSFSLSPWLETLLGVADQSAAALLSTFRVAAVAIALSFVNELLRGFASSLLKPLASMVGMAAGRIAGILAIVVLLIGGYGLPSIAVGALVVEIVGLATNLVSARGLFQLIQTKIRFDSAISRDLLKTGPALFLARLSVTASQELEPLLITLFIAPEVTAAYMVARRMADMLNQLLSIVAGSILGTFSHLVSQSDRMRVVQVAAHLLTLTLTLCVVCYAVYVSANQSFVRLWVGDEMLVSQATIAAIGVAFLIKTFKGMPYQLLMGLNDFNFVSAISIGEGVIRLLLCIVLLRPLGVVGLPLALAVSNLLSSTLLLNKLRIVLDIKLSTSRLLRLATLSGLTFAIGPVLALLDAPIDSWLSLMIYVLGATILTGAAAAAANLRVLKAFWSVQ